MTQIILNVAKASALPEINEAIADHETRITDLEVNGGGGGTVAFDAVPVSESQKAVRSGGLFTAFAGKVDKETGKSLMLDAERTKLTDVAAGATVNSTDAQLRDRTTHTGTQATSTISGLDAALAGKEPAITAGTTAQYIRGDKSLGTLLADVVGSVLTGIVFTTNRAITAADSILVAMGILQKQITDHDTTLGLKAPLASPALTGTPTAPTASNGTNTTQIATTAFVLANAAGSGDVTTTTTNPSASGTLSWSWSTKYNDYIATTSGNITFANPTGLVAGMNGKVFVRLGGAGHTVSFGANWIWVVTPSLPTAVDSKFWIQLTTDGTYVYAKLMNDTQVAASRANFSVASNGDITTPRLYTSSAGIGAGTGAVGQGVISLLDYTSNAPIFTFASAATSGMGLTGNGTELSLMFSGTKAISISTNGKISLPATNTAAGTTGAQTINKPSGTVNIAAAGTSVVVTNSLVTATSIVHAVIRTNDSTAYIKNVVPGAGSFTINLGAAATGEISIGFTVFN